MNETKLADVQKGFTTLMESATKSAPAGSESAFAFFNQAMSVSQNAFKTARTSAQQAVDAAQSNFTAATKQAVFTMTQAMPLTSWRWLRHQAPLHCEIAQLRCRA